MARLNRFPAHHTKQMAVWQFPTLCKVRGSLGCDARQRFSTLQIMLACTDPNFWLKWAHCVDNTAKTKVHLSAGEGVPSWVPCDALV